MKLSLLLSVLTAVIFTSCSTAYKTGQTPDDVYYSPVVEKETKREVVRREEAFVDPEQRQIRMQAFDPRWRSLDDRYDYGSRFSPYRYGYNYDYYYNPYFYNFPVYNNSFWPIYNNPYGFNYNYSFWPNFSFVNQRSSAPRMTNLSSYNSSRQLSTFNPKSGATNNSNTFRRYNNSNSEGNNRRVIRPSSDTYNNSGNNNTRTYSPSSSSPSTPQSSGNSGGGTPVQRNGRGQ
jgi:hypothetical protein